MKAQNIVTSADSRPTLFLDFDDVLALNEIGGYGGYDIISPNPPEDLMGRLFSSNAVALLNNVVLAFNPRVVLTTSWLRFLGRDAFVRTFDGTGLTAVAHRLHEVWDAQQNVGQTRANAIDTWLKANHLGEPYVILDDNLSGTGLRDSRHFRAGRVALCEVSKGLCDEHLPLIREALSR